MALKTKAHVPQDSVEEVTNEPIEQRIGDKGHGIGQNAQRQHYAYVPPHLAWHDVAIAEIGIAEEQKQVEKIGQRQRQACAPQSPSVITYNYQNHEQHIVEAL